MHSFPTTVALALILTAVCVAAKVFPGPCPHVPPKPARFIEDNLLRVWYATHYAGGALFHSYSCVKNNITSHPSGLLVNTSLDDQDGVSVSYVMAEFTTSTPGIYYTSVPGAGVGIFVISGTESYVFINGFLMTWGCVNNNDSHIESAFVSSPYGITPTSYIETFAMYLRRYNSPLRVFNKIRSCKVHSADDSAVEVYIKIRNKPKKNTANIYRPN